MALLLLALIYLAFISLGLPDSLLGSAWPTIHKEMNIDVDLMGVITILICSGTIISSLFSDKLAKKAKPWLIVVSSILLTSFAMLGFSLSTKFWMLCLFAIPYGLGAGAIDSTLNNYVALHYSSKHMSWLHSFWGVGTIISPYVMSYALTYHNSYQLGYRIISLTQLGIFLVIFLSAPIWKKVKTENNLGINNTELRLLTFKEKFKIKGIFFILIAFFSYCSFEATLMSWSATYLVNVKDITEAKAASYAALFFIGMTLGRFILGFISDKFNDRTMIRMGIFIILSGLLFLLLPLADYFSLIGLVIIGIGCGPIYPCIIHSTPSNFSPENSSAVISLQMSFAYLGSTLMPPIYGLFVKYVSAKIFPFFILFFVILLIIMTESLNRLVKRRKKGY